MREEHDAVVVYITAGSPEEAATLARALARG
jgi:hypothetical protein